MSNLSPPDDWISPPPQNSGRCYLIGHANTAGSLAPAPPANIVDRTEIVFDAPKAPALEDEDEESGPKYQYYKSSKVLGKLYRAIDEKKIWKENIHRATSSQGTSVWDQLSRYIRSECEKLGDVNWRPLQDDARRIRQA